MLKKKNYTKGKLARFYSWDDYGIDKERLNILKSYCRNEEYNNLVVAAAYIAEPYIAKWIIESVTTGKTYESIEFDRKLGRIPCGRTDFYGYRRRFYDIFDIEIRKIEFGTKLIEDEDKIRGEHEDS